MDQKCCGWVRWRMEWVCGWLDSSLPQHVDHAGRPAGRACSKKLQYLAQALARRQLNTAAKGSTRMTPPTACLSCRLRRHRDPCPPFTVCRFDIEGHTASLGRPEWQAGCAPAAKTAPILERIMQAGGELVGVTNVASDFLRCLPPAPRQSLPCAAGECTSALLQGAGWDGDLARAHQTELCRGHWGQLQWMDRLGWLQRQFAQPGLHK